jgi:hypothetical protein
MYHFANLTDAQLRVVALKQVRNVKACTAIIDEINRRTVIPAKRTKQPRKRVAHTGELL